MISWYRWTRTRERLKSNETKCPSFTSFMRYCTPFAVAAIHTHHRHRHIHKTNSPHAQSPVYLIWRRSTAHIRIRMSFLNAKRAFRNTHTHNWIQSQVGHSILFWFFLVPSASHNQKVATEKNQCKMCINIYLLRVERRQQSFQFHRRKQVRFRFRSRATHIRQMPGTHQAIQAAIYSTERTWCC